MHRTIHQHTFGNATITIFNVGHSRFDLAGSLDADKSEWSPCYDEFFTQPVIVPIQCIHIALPTTTVLVDAGYYDFPPDSPFVMTGDYTPPPHLLDQMAAANISPDAVEHLIITHLHGDHYNALTIEQNGRWVPAFSNAKCYIGRADWERPITQEALNDPDSLDGQTLGVLNQQGLLELVEGEYAISSDVKIFPTPGETPAHQIVQIQTGEHPLYCLGDLYHHPVEAEQPGWSVKWSDGKANKSSRDWFSAVAVEEQALLIATHIDGIGRLEETSEGVAWVTV